MQTIEVIGDLIEIGNSSNLKISAELKKRLPPDEQKAIDDSNIVKSF